MVSPFLMLLPIILLLVNMSTYCSKSCPETIHFSCPDNVYNGTFPSSHFTNTSVDPFCGGPCELRCDYTHHTRIKCNDPEQGYQVLDINPTKLAISVNDPGGWLNDPCQAYSSFALFKSVSYLTTGSGESKTFYGCKFWGQVPDYIHYTVCAIHDGSRFAIVFDPESYDAILNAAFPPECTTFHSNTKDHARKRTVELRIALPSVAISAALIVGFVGLYYRYKKKRSLTNQNVEAFLRTYGSSIPQRYTYSEIKRMTISFKVKVGQGGFGSVYKGSLIDGRIVAVKLLNKSKGDNGEEFINEVATIGRTNHVNIVSLLGFCFQHNKRALVYEFMPNGSLDKFTKARDHIHHGGSKSLTWKTMFEIFLGIARGLEYLHRGCQTRILHFDIKPHNILLDENFCPKISDFGLAKLYPQDKQSEVTMSEARGTIGYIAPEVFNRGFGQVSHKSDVYSYGMMVLEVIGSRRRANDGGQTSNSDMYFPRWIYKQMDSGEDVDDIVSDEDKEVKRKLILVSLWCIQTVPSSRPSMSRVVQMLEGQLDTAEIPPMPTLSSPPRLNLDLFTISSEG